MQPTERRSLMFEVLGVPVPKGSGKAVRHRHTGKAIYLPANPNTGSWQQAIAKEAHLHMGSELPMEGPVEVQVTFYMPRPKSAPKRVTEPTTSRNDIDKLLRTCLDGMKAGGVYVDDGQVIHVAARKTFAGGVHDALGVNGLPRMAVMVWGVATRKGAA